MPKGVDAAVLSAIGQQHVKPVFFVEIGFDTAGRYSSAETITWNSLNWQNQELEVTGSMDSPRIVFYNAGTTLGQVVLTDGISGRSCKIWKTYAYTKKNLLTYTEAFNNSVWVKSGGTITADYADSPAGNKNADRFVITTTSRYLEYNSNFTGSHTFSIFARTESGTEAARITRDGTTLSTFTVDTTWRRYFGSGTFSANSPRFQLDTNGTVQVWGAQLETGTTCTPYQPVVSTGYTVTGTEPTGYTIPVLVFDGELVSSTISDTVELSCRQHPPRMVPRHRINEPIFNHIPRRGTRFTTPSGIVVLE